MECLTEFTCSVFIDGELPAAEAGKVEAHIATCAPCRQLIHACREEQRMLIACIQEIDFTDSVPAVARAPVVCEERQARPADLAKFGGMLVGLTVFIRLAMSSPETYVLPSIPGNLDWLDPSSLSGRLSWLGNAISYVAAEGVSTMASLVNDMSVVALMVLILGGVGLLVRRTLNRGVFAATLSALGVVLLMLAALPVDSYAIDVRANPNEQNKVIVVRAGEVIDDSLFAAGDSVTIDGTVNGDLIAFGRQVTIHGTVTGNVLAAAQNVDIQGSVGGTIIAAGNTVQINGKVTHNVVGAGQTVTVGKDGNIGGDFAAFGNDSHVSGSVAHNFYAFGLADIAGSIGRDVVFRGGAFTVFPTAKIGGNLTSHVQKAESVHINPGSTIGGKQNIEISKREPAKTTLRSVVGRVFSELLHVAAAFVTGFLLLLLFPAVRRVNFANVVTVLKSGGIGFLALVAMPIAALILLITLVGIPIALVGFLAWLLGMYLAKIVIAIFIGRTLVARDSERMASAVLGLLAGLALVFIAINLPYIGGLLHFLLILIGFGGLIMLAVRSYQPAPGSGI